LHWILTSYMCFNWRCEDYEVRWLCVTKEAPCMKISNWIFKIHQQTFKYQITFHMMKTMYGTHKIIITNEHSICFHGKNIKRTIFFWVPNFFYKKGVHSNQSERTTNLLHLNFHQSLSWPIKYHFLSVASFTKQMYVMMVHFL